ncbi:MAG: sigma-54 dependent transcriptional regulator [Arenicellales bacterium]|jgi:DNA-binding NtrC family response regulator|nr:sigma-54 dependent transcriptional regulator [Arenicellales bacterium]MDP6312773.1 sigma-54 dependent transcriptional regulator [Arenicellales bacterium]MDP7192059.1 sigma-54 dependent transcriptional regulator [Arenicellales bacterium]MEE1558175.1 sigma-54 dependent transcriptional regulator [Arenicellales bacterium]HCV19962.1 transcriptional regulator [Gammaproteobacteria bacterium]|tara:strand:- start:117 stop:1499 length:1383 start_codon:yes stop_codon:yes gene_type:complete
MSKQTVLVVDDEPDIRQVVNDVLADEGYSVETACNAAEARKKFSSLQPDLVLLDIWMPDGDGIALLTEWRQRSDEQTPVIMISGHGTVETAVEAIRIGAYDFLEKPLSTAKLLVTVARGLESRRLLTENTQLRSRIEPAAGFIGHSNAVTELKHQIERIAPTNNWVLIRGEAGVGKGVAARALHRASRRADGPFIEVNLGAMPPGSVAIQLFGTEDGANVQPGRLEQASGGTLVLDEVGDLDNDTQTKLLSALEAGRFYRLGGNTALDLDVRIIATSNQNLEDKITDENFREDLYYRLNAVPLTVVPLREHREDVPDLIAYYTRQITDSEHLAFRRFSTSSVNYLRNRPWPGNVRELRNFIHRLLLTSTSEEIDADETREAMGMSASPVEKVAEKNAWKDFGQPLKAAREHFERDYLVFHLRQSSGNITELARRTGLERTHLYRKLKGLGIDPKSEEYRP